MDLDQNFMDKPIQKVIIFPIAMVSMIRMKNINNYLFHVLYIMKNLIECDEYSSFYPYPLGLYTMRYGRLWGYFCTPPIGCCFSLCLTAPHQWRGRIGLQKFQCTIPIWCGQFGELLNFLMIQTMQLTLPNHNIIIK